MRRRLVLARVAAVAGTVFFAAVLVWLYGIGTTLLWAAAMTAFLGALWLATVPLRARRRRLWTEMGLGPDGRPQPAGSDEQEPEAEASPPSGRS